ncbi:MAG: cation:proton antiporter [Dehalococcoidia bacterium]|nr:cation:proton antiporter [Dehalococcoidia bacterium]MDD5493848.1 cation:proton antiporter [Dehalococcoidia bacterium]
MIFAAHLFEAVFRQTRIPDVLPLVIIGLLLGPLFNIATPTHFGAVGPVFTTITFILILFDAGIGLSISALRKTYKVTFMLSTISFVLTLIVVGAAGFFMTDLGIIRSLLLASVVGAISSAIIAPMLNKLKMHAEGKAVLLLESSISDVYCVLATISLIEIAKLGDMTEFDIGLTIGKVIASFTLAIALGMVSAAGWSVILNKVRNLQNSTFTTAAFVFVVFGIAEWLGYSGAVAALVFGITLGNIGSVRLPRLRNFVYSDPSELTIDEKAFFSELVFILKTLFFVYIGISLRLANWWLLLIGLILTIIIYVIRMPIVRFTVAKSTPVSDASMLSAVIPRGLAAAVLASIPFQQGISGGETIQNIAYSVVLISIAMTSLLVFLIDKTKMAAFYDWFFSNLNRQADPDP